ncbi:MAG: HPF/RaiA family ribosome-associated protein [Bryobacteraceae bacterium]
MRVQVQARGIERDSELVGFVQRRAQFALGRFSGFVQSVSVRLWEDPEPPAQCGCDVRVLCGFQTPLKVRAQHNSYSAAVIDALDRAERAVSRHWYALRDPSHSAPPSAVPFGD